MTVKQKISRGNNIIIGEAGRINRMSVNVIADFILVAVSGSSHKEHMGIPDGGLKFRGGLSGAKA